MARSALHYLLTILLTLALQQESSIMQIIKRYFMVQGLLQVQQKLCKVIPTCCTALPRTRVPASMWTSREARVKWESSAAPLPGRPPAQRFSPRLPVPRPDQERQGPACHDPHGPLQLPGHVCQRPARSFLMHPREDASTGGPHRSCHESSGERRRRRSNAAKPRKPPPAQHPRDGSCRQGLRVRRRQRPRHDLRHRRGLGDACGRQGDGSSLRRCCPLCASLGSQREKQQVREADLQAGDRSQTPALQPAVPRTAVPTGRGGLGQGPRKPR